MHFSLLFFELKYLISNSLRILHSSEHMDSEVYLKFLWMSMSWFLFYEIWKFMFKEITNKRVF